MCIAPSVIRQTIIDKYVILTVIFYFLITIIITIYVLPFFRGAGADWKPGSAKVFIRFTVLSVTIVAIVPPIPKEEITSSYICRMFSDVCHPLNILQHIMTDFIVQSRNTCPVIPLKEHTHICLLDHKSIVKHTRSAFLCSSLTLFLFLRIRFIIFQFGYKGCSPL